MKWPIGKIIEARPCFESPWLKAEIVGHLGDNTSEPIVLIVERDPVWHGAQVSRKNGALIREARDV